MIEHSVKQSPSVLLIHSSRDLSVREDSIKIVYLSAVVVRYSTTVNSTDGFTKADKKSNVAMSQDRELDRGSLKVYASIYHLKFNYLNMI